MLIIAVALMAIVVGTSCNRQKQYQVTVSPEMGDLVSVTKGKLKPREDYWITVLQFQNGFAVYEGKVPSDSSLIQEFKGFAPTGASYLWVADRVFDLTSPLLTCNWQPFKLYHFMGSNVATTNYGIDGERHDVELFDFVQTDVHAQNFAGLVFFQMPG